MPTDLEALEEVLVNSDLAVTASDGTGTAAAAGNYRVTVTAPTTGRDFSISRGNTGVLTYNCTPVGGGCPSGGLWN